MKVLRSRFLGPTYRMDCWRNDILHTIGIILLLFLEPNEHFFIKKIPEKAEGSCFMSNLNTKRAISYLYNLSIERREFFAITD